MQASVSLLALYNRHCLLNIEQFRLHFLNPRRYVNVCPSDLANCVLLLLRGIRALVTLRKALLPRASEVANVPPKPLPNVLAQQGRKKGAKPKT